MSEVVVTQAHTLGAEQARAKISSFEEMLEKYRVKVDWKGNSGKLKGTGVSGHINVTDTDVTVKIKLGMLARAAGVDAKRLQSSIEKRLGPALAGE